MPSYVSSFGFCNLILNDVVSYDDGDQSHISEFYTLSLSTLFYPRFSLLLFQNL